jgi:hypothetical protein
MSNFLTRPNSTQKLANYLKTFLNEQFEKEILASGGTIGSDTIIIRSVRNVDAINVPLSEFPLLKVYKNRDIFKKGTLFRTSQGTITYSVSYPQLEVLPNLLDWMSYQINLGLMTYEMAENGLLPPPNNEGYVAEYLLSANEQLNVVFPFIRFNINFKNFCDQEQYQQ